MLLAVLEFCSVMLAAAVMGMFLGPWAALTRSLGRLEPTAFVPVLHRLSPNMAAVMTILMPAGLLAILSVIVLTAGQGLSFFAYVASFALFSAALIVTMAIEVPLVRQMETWEAAAMPPGWQHTRDRWVSFHRARVVCGLLGLAVLVAATIAR